MQKYKLRSTSDPSSDSAGIQAETHAGIRLRSTQGLDLDQRIKMKLIIWPEIDLEWSIRAETWWK